VSTDYGKQSLDLTNIQVSAKERTPYEAGLNEKEATNAPPSQNSHSPDTLVDSGRRE